jgi:hypothetical protein
MVLLGSGCIPIFLPFLQLPLCTDPIGGEPLTSLGQFGGKLGIATEDGSGADDLVKQVAQDLLIHRRSPANRRVMRVRVLGRKR